MTFQSIHYQLSNNAFYSIESADVDRAIPFNWMFGDGTAPKRGRRATSDQNRFQRLRDHMKGTAAWFVHNATRADLRE
jgi:hypothetical protein